MCGTGFLIFFVDGVLTGYQVLVNSMITGVLYYSLLSSTCK